jgi:hypothetical protein
MQPSGGDAPKDPKLAKMPQKAWWNPNQIMAVFTGVIAFAAILQVCIYKSQLDVMRIDQRAWLAVKYTPFSPPSLGARVPAPIYTINIGKTVAKDVKGWIYFRPVPIATAIDLNEYSKVEPSSLPGGEPIPAWCKFKTGVMFPNDPVLIPQIAIASTPVGRNIPEPRIWDQPLQDQWSRGEIYLALHGKFTYNDAAGISHWTTFCNTFVAANSGKSVSMDTSDLCIAFNTVDDNK